MTCMVPPRIVDGEANPTTALDSTDRRILNLLQQDAGQSISSLADKVGLSPSSCHRRVQRLKRSRVILGEVAVVDRRFSPHPVTVIVQVALERHTSQTRQAFQARMKADSMVSQCYAVAGAADYIVVIQVASMGQYEAEATRLFAQDPHVKQYSPFVATSEIKSTTAIRF